MRITLHNKHSRLPNIFTSTHPSMRTLRLAAHFGPRLQSPSSSHPPYHHASRRRAPPSPAALQLSSGIVAANTTISFKAYIFNYVILLTRSWYLYIETGFSTSFYEHDSGFTSLDIPFFNWNLPRKKQNIDFLLYFLEKMWFNMLVSLPFFDKISFISDKNDDHITTTFCSYFLNPLWSVQKWLSVCIYIHISYFLIINHETYNYAK